MFRASSPKLRTPAIGDHGRWAHDETLQSSGIAARPLGKTRIVLERPLDERVVPPADVESRRQNPLVPIPDRQSPPEAVACVVLEPIEEIVRDVRILEEWEVLQRLCRVEVREVVRA